jgi:hypothetical protein
MTHANESRARAIMRAERLIMLRDHVRYHRQRCTEGLRARLWRMVVGVSNG